MPVNLFDNFDLDLDLECDLMERAYIDNEIKETYTSVAFWPWYSELSPPSFTFP